MQFDNLQTMHSKSNHKVSYQAISKDDQVFIYLKYHDVLGSAEFELARQIMDENTANTKSITIFSDFSEVAQPVERASLLGGLIDSGDFEELIKIIGKVRKIYSIDPNKVFDISVLTSITKLINIPQQVELLESMDDINNILNM